MPAISAVINVIPTEVEILPQALESVKDVVDEIIIVDMTAGSAKLTSIAKKFDAKLFPHEFVNYVEPVRNFGVSKATGEWILILDPDEELSPNLKKTIKEVVKGDYSYFRIPRKNLVFGRWLKHSRWWPDYNIRLFKKGAVSWNEIIHAVPVTQGKGMDMEEREENAIVHHHYASLEQFIDRMNRYTSIQAKRKMADGYKFNCCDLLTAPPGEFFSRFFAGEGYRDGLHGFAMALLQAFSELVVYLKVWQEEGFKEEEVDLNNFAGGLAKINSDLNYWIADAKVKTKGGVVNRIKRKLRVR